MQVTMTRVAEGSGGTQLTALFEAAGLGRGTFWGGFSTLWPMTQLKPWPARWNQPYGMGDTCCWQREVLVYPLTSRESTAAYMMSIQPLKVACRDRERSGLIRRQLGLQGEQKALSTHLGLRLGYGSMHGAAAAPQDAPQGEWQKDHVLRPQETCTHTEVLRLTQVRAHLWAYKLHSVAEVTNDFLKHHFKRGWEKAAVDSFLSKTMNCPNFPGCFFPSP